MPFNPTPEQQRVIVHPQDRHACVLAGPGTGKSATLVALLTRVVSENPRLRVGMLTFTRAATQELAKKVLEHAAEANVRPSTVHSFALSVLVRNPGAAGLPDPLRIADDWEYTEVVLPSLARRMASTPTEVTKLFREQAANWESLVEGEDPEIDPGVRARFLGAWIEHREIFGYTLLSELPYALRRLLLDHPDAEGLDWDLLIVDEYQDLNACDLEVARRLGDRGCVVIGVGDDDQSIYSFRKAAPEGIRRFAADFVGAAQYSLSIGHRLGNNILEWATRIIDRDPDRPAKPRMTPAAHCVPGDVHLLAFSSQSREAEGIARIVRHLIRERGVAPSEIMILLRADHNGAFSNPIKEKLRGLGIEVQDTSGVNAMLAEPGNRLAMELLRVAANPDDSVAWGALIRMEQGLGDRFFDGIYEMARAQRLIFSEALRHAAADGFVGIREPARRIANDLVTHVRRGLEELDVPPMMPEDGWGNWITGRAGAGIVPNLSDDLVETLRSLDEVVEADISLSRYLGQVGQYARDRASSSSDGVRVMTMSSAKGLTVTATVVAALEDEVIPRPSADLAEERRLLYVAMTRSTHFLFCTWARQRTGPTARSGKARVAMRRSLTRFLAGDTVETEDGGRFVGGLPR